MPYDLMKEHMERRQFLTLPLAALTVPALLAGGAGSAHASSGPAPAARRAAPARALKGASNSGMDPLSLRQIKSLKPEWYYTWLASRTYTGAPFVPMIRDANKLLERDALGYVNRELGRTKTRNLLGFNEPDLRAQANMSVDEAVRLWPLLQTTGLRLGSPATISPTAAWLDQFMLRAKREKLRVDFMTMHCYAWPNSADFLEKVTALHEKYDRPVWVTEYAVADWNATRKRRNEYSRREVETFMRETVKGMRAMPFVERFAWKTRAITDRQMGTSALFDLKGKMTSTGRLYASL